MQYLDTDLLKPSVSATGPRAEARLRFLIDAGTTLDGSLDLMTTLTTLARIVVDRLGDICFVDMLWDADHTERVVVEHADPALAAQARAEIRRWPSIFAVDSPEILGTLHAGRTFFMPSVSSEDVAMALHDPDQLASGLSWGFRSAVMVPLVAQGRVLGAISVCLTGSGAPFTAEDVVLVEDLARRASMAVENSRLYTELRRADRAQRFLSEASRALASSLDWDTTLRTITRQAVLGIADICGVDYVDARGRVRFGPLEHVDPAKRALCDELRPRVRLREDGEVWQTLQSGRSVLIPEVDEDGWTELVRGSREDVDRLRRLNLTSTLFVPMTSREHLPGVIFMGITESDRRFDAADLALAEELGRRAGVAADNARLYTDRSRVALTLQRSLMPTEPPAVPHLDVAARFRPAGDGTELGGDFYDLFTARGGHWTAVVGDVCGKGAAAASLTALARHTIRTAARYETSPAAVLHALDRAVSEQSTTRLFCTAALVDATPTPAGCAVRVARGGHPPVLVLRGDGTVETLEPAGAVLGVLERIELAEADAVLRPGDALVLYTDGVIEAGAPGAQLGEEWLAATVAALAGEDAETIADHITRQVLDVEGGRPSDDLAVLVLRAVP